jgi:hypothetical protein
VHFQDLTKARKNDAESTGTARVFQNRQHGSELLFNLLHKVLPRSRRCTQFLGQRELDAHLNAPKQVFFLLEADVFVFADDKFLV